MPDFALQRRMMVDGQLRTYDVTEPRLIAAMDEVPRERFVADPATAYLDRPAAMSAQSKRMMMTPMVFARLVQSAAPTPTDSVLVVGAGTGYGAAVMARLAARVVALESDEALSGLAKAALAEAGAETVTVVTGPLRDGYGAAKPYDVIVVEGAIEVEPTHLLAQLAQGGRLVCVVGRGRAGRATLYTRTDEVTGQRTVTEAAAPLLEAFAKEPSFVF